MCWRKTRGNEGDGVLDGEDDGEDVDDDDDGDGRC
jgi:hypothetical protein